MAERVLELTCVGMRHRITKPTIREISEATPVKIKLVREADNLHDENAIAVICREPPWRNMKLGYVSRQTAAELAPRLDAEKIVLTESWLLSADAESGSGEMKVNFRKPHG